MNSLLKRSAIGVLGALAIVLASPTLAATLTLSTNAAGDYQALDFTGAATRWQAVQTQDEGTSYVYRSGGSFVADTYNLEDTAQAGTINSVTVYARILTNAVPNQTNYALLVLTNGSVYSTVALQSNAVANTWANYSVVHPTNPSTMGLAWTWADINALQAGVDIQKPRSTASNQTQVTRVWVVVDYTPPVVNTPPVATNNSYTTNEDTQLNTGNLITDNTGSGVDSDAEGDPMTASKVSNPSNGSATVNGNGTFTYDPNPNYCGADSFTYKVNDGTADSNTATVSITINCVNDVPSFTSGGNAGVLEDSGAYSAAWATDISAGPANESFQLVSFNVSNDNNALFSSQPAVSAAGVLSFTPAADANGAANVTINIMDNGGTAFGGVDTSANQFFVITVTAVNDEPSFTVQNDTSNEDAGPQTGVVVGNNFSAGPANESGQSLLNCIVSNVSVDDWLLSSGPTVYEVGNECHLDYTAAANANGSFTFDLAVQDDGGTANGGDDTSDAQTVTVTILAVNDPPTVTYLSPASQTVDYSDYIGTVSISVTDIDDSSTGLTESNEPPDSTASLSLTPTTPACVEDYTLSPNPLEGGSVCSWTYDGQVLDPGDNVHSIYFTPSDGDGGNAAGKGTHTLTIEPEDATVQLDDANPVSIEVDAPGSDSSLPFSLYFTAWETNDSGFPQPDEADFSHTGDPLDAADGDFTKALGFLTLSPVGPGGPTTVACSEAASGGSGYGEWTTFQCDFDDVPVNTYEVLAEVDGSSATTRYYYGYDEDAFVVYDPSLGFTTAGGWFYWPGTAIDDEADPCDGYPGDKTNFGYVMKYNKKGNKVQGSALMQRHTIDPVTCFDAGSYRVKSNALYGLAIGEVPEDHGWAAFAGKATYREPGLDNEGNHLFFIYAEDHGEQGCNQDPSDRIWIEVWDKDDLVVMTLGPDAQDDAEDIQCGNIYVPHTPANP